MPTRETILMADDDPEDCELAHEAMIEADLPADFVTVKDGEDLLNYLRRIGDYADPGKAPRPLIVLLDLNMPRIDGHEVLRQMKQDSDLAKIPVVVLTTSSNDRDIDQAYEEGARSYIVKPSNFPKLVQTLRDLGRYWLDVVQVPGRKP